MAKENTWNDLKTFANSLTEEQLQQPIIVDVVEVKLTTGVSFYIQDEDYMSNISDNDDQGRRSDVEQWCEADPDNYDIDDYKVIIEKGTALISVD